jgi:hypothetical protein
LEVDLVASHASEEVVAQRNCVVSQYATEVVEKKYPLSYEARLKAAEVVENACPWLRERNDEADVVEKKYPLSRVERLYAAEVVEKEFARSDAAEYPPSVPVQLPDVLSVRRPPEFWRPVPSSDVNAEPPSVKLVVERLVEDAVVAKNAVDVAFAKVVLPVNALVPEKVLELASSVVEAPRAARVDS